MPPTSAEKICLRSLISGQVQGVCYRLYTREKALELGLTGWVQNLPDGRVEAVVQGDRDSVDRMVNWFWQGPPAAQVKTVDTEPQALQDFSGFEIRR